MERIEYRRSDEDKKDWSGRSLWRDEPDKIQFPDKETGMPCLMVRNSAGAWCGYVAVTEGHPYFKVDYNDFEDYLYVHGGVTFTGECRPNASEERGICHVPGEDESDDVWWIGFDTAHHMDFVPGFNKHLVSGDVYRNQGYVESECTRLAKQLIDIQHNGVETQIDKPEVSIKDMDRFNRALLTGEVD